MLTKNNSPKQLAIFTTVNNLDTRVCQLHLYR